MKKFLLIVAVAALTVLADSQLASAGRRGGRGGRGGCGGCGGGYSSCGMGGYGHGGCGTGGCGMGGYVGGCATCGGNVGYISGGCATCGGSVANVGGVALGGSCPGGVCSINGGPRLALTTGAEATLVVTLPADAKLTIDGEKTTSTSAERVFVSPALESGKEYEYTLKAQIVRDGEVKTATARVTVRSGEVSRVELKVPAAGVAAQ